MLHLVGVLRKLLPRRSYGLLLSARNICYNTVRAGMEASLMKLFILLYKKFIFRRGNYRTKSERPRVFFYLILKG